MDKLKPIITRIQASGLSHEVKADLYVTIQEGLRSVALPILVKHMPPDALNDLSQHPENVTPDSYIKLIDDTVKDGTALKELNDALADVLTKVEEKLKKHGV
ncbi:hypothetical protein HY087_02105 [Candidatus Gottesmanbacteria bacterium]|nr:hypothetical protein [Candidatus Gottesmanbacteria bacterium]